MIFGEGILTSMGKSLFSKKRKEKRTMYLLGDRHRAHRKLFNPAFSIAHMREIGMCQRTCINLKEHPIDQAVIFIFLLVPIFYEVGYKVTTIHTLHCSTIR